MEDHGYAAKTAPGGSVMLPTCVRCLHLQRRLAVLDRLYQDTEHPPNVTVLYTHVQAQKAAIEMALVEWDTLLLRRQQHALEEGAARLCFGTVCLIVAGIQGR